MKKVIVTGASSGIGLSTAKHFDDQDFDVLNISRRPCPIETVTSIACNLLGDEAETQLRAFLPEWVGDSEQTILIHNAAQLYSDTVTSCTPESLRSVLEINVVAPSMLNRLVIPLMKAGSSIIYIGSTLSEKAVANSFSYVTSKHALLGMMRATCQDLAGQGIHTACVCPGFTDTEMLRDHVPADVLPMLADMSAYGRLVEPEEIAESVFWAATHPVINGAVIHTNLGQIER